MAKRQCQGRTAKGRPCQAAPLTDSDYCSAHDPMRPDETRFGSPVQAGVAGASPKPRQPRAVEVARERVEADIDKVLAPYFDALEAVEIATVAVGDGESLRYATDYPDHDTRMKAADRLLDRVYGKPRQQMEHSGPDRGAIPLELDADASKAAHEFLARITRA